LNHPIQNFQKNPIRISMVLNMHLIIILYVKYRTTKEDTGIGESIYADDLTDIGDSIDNYKVGDGIIEYRITTKADDPIILLGVQKMDPIFTVTPTPEVSTSQRNALNKAKEYLSIQSFSHDGLVKQLEFEKFTTEDATYAADNCGADWNEQAAKKAAQYMDLMSFSKEKLISQLEFDGFTEDQANYGAQSVGY